MKRKTISLLLCAAMLITIIPSFSLTASAEAEPILAYVPLDNRPVNIDRVIYVAESAGFKVMMPDPDLYSTRLDGQPLNSNGTQFGDSKKLMEWILEMDEVTDHFVISLDQLLSGGLVNSREISRTRYTDEFNMIDAIIELSKNNHVYIIDTVLRLAACTLGFNNADLDTYNYLRSYSMVPRRVLQGHGLNINRIVQGYTRNENLAVIPVSSTYTREVRESLRSRERKLNLIDYILTKDASGRIKYFIGIDDSTPQNTIHTNEINYIRQKLGDRGLIFSGTDELGMMAVLSLMIDYYDYDVSVATTYYGDTESVSSGSIFDIETVKENVDKHVESIGVRQTSRADADVEIVVLTPPAQAILSARYINRMIDHINDNISKGIPTIVINVNPGAYSGNFEFRMVREVEMSMLLAYSSWNTVGNAIGLALCNGISRYLYLQSRDISSDYADIAFIRGLAFSFLKDFSYQRGGGRTLFNNYLNENEWSTSNFYQSDEQAAMVHAEIERIFKTAEYNITVNDILGNMTGTRYFKGLDGECGIIQKIDTSNYYSPFFRTFELRFDIDVELSDISIHGFRDNLTINMPFNPGDGQLAYLLSLYFVDESGKVHEIPSTYDRNTGYASFTTSNLPHFFTRALTIEQEKAYSLFTDVPPSAWYFDHVLYVYDNGLMRGTTANTFEPNASMTRAMLAHTIYNMAGAPAAADDYETPQDAGNLWYTPAVVWAVENEIAGLDRDGNFGPNDPATREQMANMLWRYAVYLEKNAGNGNLPGIHNYADVYTVSTNMREGLNWACSRGVITGTSDERLRPHRAATRAETAAVLQRFNELML